MHKRQSSFREAFTLIEVMVAVMIVSVVIAALFQMRGNASHKLHNIKKTIHTNQYNSLFLFNDKYGFESSNTDMKSLVEDFNLDSDLRRSLNDMKLKIDYNELKIIDTNEYNSSEQESSTGIIFEIGATLMSAPDFDSSLIRVRIQ